MFKFFKEKLKSFFKKSKEEIEEKAEKQEETEAKTEREEEKKIEAIKEEKITEKPLKEEAEGEKEAKETKEEALEQEPKKDGFFARLKKRFETVKLEEGDFDKIWQDLELLLMQNNVAMDAIKAIKEKLKIQLVANDIKKNEIETRIRDALKKAISDLLLDSFDITERAKQDINENGKPFVIVFFGVNGGGKTTTIAKLAHALLKKKLSCVFAASDTFRAASIEQLQKHASKLNVKLIKHDYGADAAAVAYDAIKYAKANGIDVVLIDTAGRMHTQSNLMREMEKICKVAKPDLKIFVGESIVGNDMIEQAKTFNEAVTIDGIILTKVDVDEKGGSAISASYVTKKPVLLLGTGQEYENLEQFNKEKLLERLGF